MPSRPVQSIIPSLSTLFKSPPCVAQPPALPGPSRPACFSTGNTDSGTDRRRAPGCQGQRVCEGRSSCSSSSRQTGGLFAALDCLNSLICKCLLMKRLSIAALASGHRAIHLAALLTGRRLQHRPVGSQQRVVASRHSCAGFIRHHQGESRRL